MIDNIFNILNRYKDQDFEITASKVTSEYEEIYGQITPLTAWNVCDIIHEHCAEYNIVIDNSKYAGKLVGLPFNIPFYVKSVK